MTEPSIAERREFFDGLYVAAGGGGGPSSAGCAVRTAGSG